MKYVILIKEPLHIDDWLEPKQQYAGVWAPVYSCVSMPEIAKNEAVAVVSVEGGSKCFTIVKSTTAELPVDSKLHFT